MCGGEMHAGQTGRHTAGRAEQEDSKLMRTTTLAAVSRAGGKEATHTLQ